jgi:hypothetical protein
VELFACHPSSRGFEGNLPEAFAAFIVGKEYGADETPKALGLYWGWYMIMFHPGELLHAMCADLVES